ncbi:multicopper oxidase domain-containing protein [Streptomyces alboflavus]
MYHCHLLEHEDMGMMRPFVVMPKEALKFDHGGGHGGHDGGHGGGH